MVDDPPNWPTHEQEEAWDAEMDARREAWIEEQVREYLAANKPVRGRPSNGRKYEIARFVHNAIQGGLGKAEARALAAKSFGVSKSYVQRLTKKRT